MAAGNCHIPLTRSGVEGARGLGVTGWGDHSGGSQGKDRCGGEKSADVFHRHFLYGVIGA